MNYSKSIEEQSSSLARSIGFIKIDKNIFLKDLFVYKTINIWSLYEPIIAIYLLPKIISKKRKYFFKYIYFLKNLLRLLSSISKTTKNYKNNNYWLFTCFSDYMYIDSLSPLIEYCKKTIPNFDHLLVDNTKKYKVSISNIIYLIDFISNIKCRIHNNKINYIEEDFISKKDLLYIIDYLLYNLIPKNFPEIQDAIQLFEINKPKVVLSIDIANPSSRIYTVLAKKYNILSIDLQYGHYESTDIEWRFSISDKIFVWGQYYFDLFEKMHFINREKLEITSSPKFDYLIKKPHFHNADKSISKIKILFASTYIISSYENIENYEVIKKFKNSIVSKISDLLNVELVIKPHPLEDLSWLNNVTLSKNIFVADKENNIKQLISDCQYFISFGSTSTFDAMLQNKICFCVNYTNTKKNIDIFIKKDIVNQINSDFDLLYILNRISKNIFYESLLTKVNRNKFLENSILTYRNNTNFSSSYLISSLINNLLN